MKNAFPIGMKKKSSINNNIQPFRWDPKFRFGKKPLNWIGELIKEPTFISVWTTDELMISV